VVLVDSSLWIAHFEQAGLLERHVANPEIATCPPVVQEVLQGIRLDPFLRTARKLLLSAAMLESPMSIDVFEHAVDIYRTGQSIGVTIRSSVDCLIAACALRNGVPVFHCDRDFETIARFTMLQSRYVLP
jgi:hypothetical protein